MADRILKSIFYMGTIGGLGYILLTLAPSDEQIKKKMKDKQVLHNYVNPEDSKRAKQFSDVLLAAATSSKTIYGAKQAKEQRLHERAKQD